MIISYMLSREYRVVKNRYSRLFLTSEDRPCTILRVQEQSTNIIQYQYPTFTWRHRWWHHYAKSEKTVPSNNGEISDQKLILAELCVQDIT